MNSLMGKREEKKLRSREKLIEAASAEFAEHGYARAHMDRISMSAGFGRGTIYNYFPSKYELLLAVVEHAMELLTAAIREETRKIADPVERMRRGLEVDFQFMIENEALSKVIIREGFAADPRRQTEFLTALAPISNLVVELLEEGKEAGKYRKDIEFDLATLVSQGIVGYMLLARWTLDDPRLTARRLADLTMKCFIEGIMART
jgi:TetR/AcrR family fatty acid metabolism transcriptional regulator